jgi:hypothetical protein
VASILEAKSPSLDGEFSSIIGNLSGKGSKQNSNKSKGKLLPWLEIKEQDPAHPLVREMESRPDEYLKAAMMLVLKEVPLKEWQREPTLLLIEATRKQIEEKGKIE